MADWGILRNLSYHTMMSSLLDRTYSPSPVYDENSFCTPDNVDQCIAFLNQELASMGMKPLSLDGISKTTSLINTVHEFLRLQQRSTRVKEDLENRIHRVSSDLTEKQSLVQRTRQERDRLEREIAQEQEKYRQLQNKHKTVAAKLKHEKDECKRMHMVIRDRDAQYKHELKKKQREVNKLMERLHQLLMDKNPDRRIGMNMIGVLHRGDGKRSTWKNTAVGTKKEEMYQVLISNYEEKQQELRVENNDLRDCLADMQRDLSSVLNRSDCSQSDTVHPKEDGLSASSSETDLSSMSTVSQNGMTDGHYQMPYEMMRENLQKNFQDLCRKIKESIRKSPKQLKQNGSTAVKPGSRRSSPSKSPGQLGDERRDNDRHGDEVEKFRKQIEKYKDIVKQQEELIQQSLQTQSKSMENSFFQESQILQEKESLSEQRRKLYQEKANFEEDRRKLTESVIQLGLERKQLDDEKTNLLKTQFLQMSPFHQSPSPPKSTASSHGERTRLLPSTPVFSPAPSSQKVKTPSTAELYRVLGLTPKSERGDQSSARKRRLPKSGSIDSISSSVQSAPCDLNKYSSAAAKCLSFEQEVEEIEKSLFPRRRCSSTGSQNSLDGQ